MTPKKVVTLAHLEIEMPVTKRETSKRMSLWNEKLGSILKMFDFKRLNCQQDRCEQAYENFVLDTSFSFIP